MVGVKEHSV
nr:unnamed protein product [Callosobruchus chinensis]